jgi:quinoprotein glucose dehydrogenase
MAGILARRGDVFVTCIPNLYRLRDDDGDGKAGTGPPERTILSGGYGARVAFRGHDLHGLVLGHDGRLYFTIGDRGYKVEYKDIYNMIYPPTKFKMVGFLYEKQVKI